MQLAQKKENEVASSGGTDGRSCGDNKIAKSPSLALSCAR